MSDAQQVQALWDGAVKRWGRVDIWINNTGISQAQGGGGICNGDDGIVPTLSGSPVPRRWGAS